MFDNDNNLDKDEYNPEPELPESFSELEIIDPEKRDYILIMPQEPEQLKDDEYIIAENEDMDYLRNCR